MARLSRGEDRSTDRLRSSAAGYRATHNRHSHSNFNFSGWRHFITQNFPQLVVKFCFLEILLPEILVPAWCSYKKRCYPSRGDTTSPVQAHPRYTAHSREENIRTPVPRLGYGVRCGCVTLLQLFFLLEHEWQVEQIEQRIGLIEPFF